MKGASKSVTRWMTAAAAWCKLGQNRFPRTTPDTAPARPAGLGS